MLYLLKAQAISVTQGFYSEDFGGIGPKISPKIRMSEKRMLKKESCPDIGVSDILSNMLAGQLLPDSQTNRERQVSIAKLLIAFQQN
jgi:hypothetical protein